MKAFSQTAEWTPLCERVARSVARGYYVHGADRDDVLQESRIGVAKALRDWHPELGSSFVSFAVLCARRQVITAVKTATRAKHGPLNHATSLDKPIPSPVDLDIGNLHDLLWREGDDPAAIVIARDEIRRLLASFRHLSGWEREVIERVVLLGQPYSTVGDRKRVDNAMQRARRKLRTAIDLPEAA